MTRDEAEVALESVSREQAGAAYATSDNRRDGCRICRGGVGDFVCHVCLERQR